MNNPISNSDLDDDGDDDDDDDDDNDGGDDDDDDDDGGGGGAYMEKRGDAGDIITANFLDFLPNFRLKTQFEAILGHFRHF